MGHGQLVPAAIAPESVHGVEQVQQGQILRHGQARPSGGAHFIKRHVRLHPVGVGHLALNAREATLQTRGTASPLQVLDDAQQGTLASVQRDKVHPLKQARFSQLTQLGVDIAPAQANLELWVVCARALGDAQGAIQGAWKGHREHQQVGAMGVQGLQGQSMQGGVDQVVLSRQGLCHRVVAGLTAGQLLGVAHEGKSVIDRIAHHIGQVVEVQRGQMSGPVVLSQSAKGPSQGVPLVLIGVQRPKAWTLRQKATAGDAVTQRGVAPLQKAQGRLDRLHIARMVVQKLIHRGAALGLLQLQGAGAQLGQPRHTEEFEHQFQGQIVLSGIDAARAQEAGEVGAGRVGGVQLRHGRDQAKHPKPSPVDVGCSLHALSFQAQARASPTLMPSTAADKMPPA